MKKNDTRLIYNRIKSAYGLKTDRELADFLGITPQVIPTSILRGSVQWDKIFQKCEFLSIDWLLTGEGEMFLNSSENCSKTDEKTIEKLTNYIEKLEKENENLTKENEKLKEEIQGEKDLNRKNNLNAASGAGGLSSKKEVV